VTTWTSTVERWLATEIEGFGEGAPWYVGRPLLVTENDYSLRLYNGDTGIVIAGGPELGDPKYVGGSTSPGDGSPRGSRPDRVVAAFERGGKVIEISPTRLASVDTVYAMTVHKAQGSQFDTVSILLPRPDSPILTRELLYTAVTRAQKTLLVAGTEEAIRAAITRPIARASGLRRALWGEEE
jgi:exodeoxyribonuclease V alpha subunit